MTAAALLCAALAPGVARSAAPPATAAPATSEGSVPATTAAPAGAPVSQNAQPLVFRDAAEEARFRALVLQLRCVMCQNQSLADSDAMIAQDLRAQILAMMRQGRSDDQIKRFLVERYTDFVLYRPEVRPTTWLLWFGPLALLIGGGLWIAGIVRRQAPPSAPPPDDQEW
jgi:cytochrome c-type biogenesis protein CcmH